MITNLYTKESSGFEHFDLCKGMDICDEVKSLYYRYKGRCEEFLPSISDADNEIHRYYVYAWYAKTEPKSYFYVGKGTGKRYNHILSDIDKYKKGKKNLRFQRYSEIQDKCGIDYEILLDKLTEYQALIYEECKKLEFLDNGEVLLNVEGIPDEFLPESWSMQQDASIPTLVKDPVYQKYLGDYGIPYFDEVTESGLMRTYIYPYFIEFGNITVETDKAIIIEWLKANNAKIYKTVSLKTESVIVQGNLRYDRYSEYRSKGKKIYSSKDVLDFINKSTPFNSKID